MLPVLCGVHKRVWSDGVAPEAEGNDLFVVRPDEPLAPPLARCVASEALSATIRPPFPPHISPAHALWHGRRWLW